MLLSGLKVLGFWILWAWRDPRFLVAIGILALGVVSATVIIMIAPGTRFFVQNTLNAAGVAWAFHSLGLLFAGSRVFCKECGWKGRTGVRKPHTLVIEECPGCNERRLEFR